MFPSISQLLSLFLILCLYTPKSWAQDATVDIKNQYQTVNQKWLQLAQQYLNSTQQSENESEGSSIFTALKQISLEREKILDQIYDEEISPFEGSDTDIKTIQVEFQLIPTRLFILSKNFVSLLLKDFSGGVSGIWNLAYDIFLLIIFLLVFTFRQEVLKPVKKFTQNQKRANYRASFHSSFYRRLNQFWDWLEDITPWVVLLFITKSFDSFAPGTRLTILLPLVYILEVYIYLKIFQTLVDAVFKRFLPLPFHRKLDRNTSTLTLVIFLFFLLQYVFASLIGSSLILALIFSSLRLIVVALLFFILGQWKKESIDYLKSLGVSSIEKGLDQIEGTGKISWLFSPVLCFFVICFEIYFYILKMTSRFDWAKKLSAQITRARFVGQSEPLKTISSKPTDYIEAFRSQVSELFLEDIQTNNKFISLLSELIGSWAQGNTDDRTLAIHGARGIGKSTLIRCLLEKSEDQPFQTFPITFHKKMRSKKDVVEFLHNYIDPKVSDENKKFVILVDGAQELFLSKIGGFEAYRAFVEIINDRYDNCFWVVTYNEQSWIYLNGVLADTQYFRKELSVPAWSDQEIKRLILETHKKTGFKLTYDPVFQMASPAREKVDMAESVENRYFQVLWEQSAGNPGIAVELWLDSLTLNFKKNLAVSLPKGMESQKVASLGSSIYFVLLALVRHDFLNLRELCQVTGLSISIVKQSLNLGIDEGIIARSDAKYRISMKGFAEVVKLLKRKNMIWSLSHGSK